MSTLPYSSRAIESSPFQNHPMPHIHELIDFTVSIYIVHQKNLLFVHHKILNKWLPVGGHIELNEDPEEALFREVKEECGLDIEVIGEKPQLSSPGTKFLLPPRYLDIHDISSSHKHVGLIYFARASSDQVKLAAEEHLDIRWLTENDLEKPEFNLLPSIKFYAKEALRIVHDA